MIKSFRTKSSIQVLLTGEISWDTLGELYESLIPCTYNKIELLISSQGGDRDAGISILSFLKGLNCTIATVGMGKVYSAAIYPFLASKNCRYAFPDTVFLFHPTTFDMEGEISIRTLEENVGADQLDSNHLATLLKQLSIPINMWNQIVNPQTSLFLSAQLAEQYGLVTKIIPNFSSIAV